MNTTLKLASAAALAAILAAPPAIAQNESAPAPGQMMPGGDMSGIMGMMQAAAPQTMAPQTTPQAG